MTVQHHNIATFIASREVNLVLAVELPKVVHRQLD